LTQAAVSQRIQSIENAFNKSLFDRRGGRVALTEAGRKLYAYAQRIDGLHREAHKEITGHEPKLTGELDIAASSVPGEYLLPSLLSGFGRTYPHLRVRAAVSDSLAVIGQVERGEVAIGLVGRKIEKSHLQFRHFSSDRMDLVAPP
jgi:DNA-binding transcriptional LysR family regulator